MKHKTTIMGISGGSCSGKSWVAKKIQSLFPDDVCLLGLDGYYKDFDYVKQLEFQHDNPSAIDYDLVLEDIERLCTGKDVRTPIYDYKTHQITGYKTCIPKRVIIVEGLFAFHDKRIRNKMNLRMWIDANEEIKLKRRITRDVKDRGDTIEDANKRYSEHVLPAYKKYIEPYKEYADFCLENSRY